MGENKGRAASLFFLPFPDKKIPAYVTRALLSRIRKGTKISSRKKKKNLFSIQSRNTLIWGKAASEARFGVRYPSVRRWKKKKDQSDKVEGFFPFVRATCVLPSFFSSPIEKRSWIQEALVRIKEKASFFMGNTMEELGKTLYVGSLPTSFSSCQTAAGRRNKIFTPFRLNKAGNFPARNFLSLSPIIVRYG